MQAYTTPVGAINAVVRSRNTGKYQVIDIAGLRLIDLNAMYRVIEVPVIDTFDRELTVVLSLHYRTELLNSTLTLNEWLTLQKDTRLITTEGFPTLETANIRYMAGFWHTGSYLMANTGWHPSNEVGVDDMNDLIVDLDNIEPKYLYEHTLWSVGGYFLPTKYQDYGVRIVDAGNVIRRGKSMTMGILNTESVGKLTTSPIAEMNITKMDSTLSYYDRVIIGTDVSLTGKTVGMVVGGHLHLLDGFVKVIGDKSVTISMKNFDYLNKIIDSKDALDLTFMGADDISSRAVVSELLSDEAIKKYLCSPYTFLVIIDNPDMYREVLAGNTVNGLGMTVVSDIDAVSWVCDKNGRTIDIWPTNSGGEWVIHNDRYTVDNFVAKTVGWESLQYINDGRVPAKPVSTVKPYLFTYSARINKA